MRRDLEALQKNSDSTASPSVSRASEAVAAAENAESQAKLTALESRLQQSSEEISRLRAERRRLMEISNELRSELSQLKREARMRMVTGLGAAEDNSALQETSAQAQSHRQTHTQTQQSRVQPESMRYESQQAFAATVVDPWLLMPVRQQQAGGGALGIADVGSGETDLKLTAQQIEPGSKRPAIATASSRRNAGRSVLSASLNRRGKSVGGGKTGASAASVPVRKVMNYARGSGEEA